MTRKDPDPITLEILWNNLNSIADECFITLMRSAFQPTSRNAMTIRLRSPMLQAI